MASFATGVVDGVLEQRDDLVRVRVTVDGQAIEAVGYPTMLGAISKGDRVVVNTTGLELELGTGGLGFVLWNLDGKDPVQRGPGHIMKMRYTPWQTEVDAVEAQESAHHDLVADAVSIEEMPVVACGLHSQIAGVAAGIKAAEPEARVGYLMTDGGALPLALSDLVRRLKQAGLIDTTATAGHAFGGDIDSINVFSGLTALHAVGRCDFVVAAMGPGVAGSDSRLGFTAIEQGQVLDATFGLAGKPVACLRISFADERDRHRGVSHHTLTTLTVATRSRCTVAVPKLKVEHAEQVARDLEESGVADLHEVYATEGEPGIELMAARDVHPSSMGRSVSDDPDFWLAAAAAGDVAVRVAHRGE